MTIRNRAAEPESVARLQELRQTLGLRAGAEEFPLELADVPSGPDELAVPERGWRRHQSNPYACTSV